MGKALRDGYRDKVFLMSKFELFKTTPRFDGTAHHPEWLG
jgi:hypothetical protein